MPAILNDPIVRLFALPFVASLLLAGLIRWVGSRGRGEQAAGASVGIVFAWAAAYELGPQLIPPSADDNNMFYMIACGLLIGIPFDFFRGHLQRGKDQTLVRNTELVVAVLFGVAASVWGRGHFDWWTLMLVAAWGIVALRITIVAADDAPIASTMLASGAAGLSAVAWSAGLETNLAFQFAAAAGGYFVLNWLDPRLRFGMTLILTGAGALMLVGLRLSNTTYAVAPSLLILGFVFFADAPVRKLFGTRKLPDRWLMPILTAIASLLPIALAALAAHIGVNYEAG
ncbi:MAG: hypothetical protein K0Q70_997 [Rhodospirillales bacterium]|nr:hypothetical protein [Rhodospirillales bacterium]